MTNLDKVPPVGALVIIGFAKPEGGTGGYARYVSRFVRSDWKYGKSVVELPGAPLPKQPYPNKRDEYGVLRPTPPGKINPSKRPLTTDYWSRGFVNFNFFQQQKLP
jgi:hypothetical protein